MPTLDDFRALAAEHNAVPAFLHTSPETGHAVLVRVFVDRQDGLRITMENQSDGIEQQLVIDPQSMRSLPDEPPPIG